MKENQILVVVKNPGERAYIDPCFENSLEAFQQAVGGYIETVGFASDVCVICNENGRLMDLPYNCTFLSEDFVGPILIVGVKGDHFCSLHPSHARLILKEFLIYESL